MTEATRRKKWLLPTLAVFLIGGAWLTFRLLFPPFAPPVLPVPNGYDELLQAAKLIPSRTGFYDEMDAEELASIVEQNAPALKMARKAMLKECMVTVDWSAGQTGLEAHLEQGSSMRGLARGFAAAAWHENANGRTDEAVRCGLDILELAPNVGRGGLVFDQEIAKAVYYSALYSLRKQVEQLSREDCLRLQKKLHASPLQLDSSSEILRRERAYFRQVNGFLQSLVMVGATRDLQKQTLASMENSEKRVEVLNTLLQTHLALRAFQLDKNQLPAKLEELVPDYMNEVPQDSFANGPLIYRPEAEGYQLYSVGSDGVDGGGVETNAQGNDLDVLLEVTD